MMGMLKTNVVAVDRGKKNEEGVMVGTDGEVK